MPMKRVLQSGKPLAYIFAEEKWDRDYFRTILNPIAKKYRNSVHMFTVDAKKYKQHVRDMLTTTDELPAFVIHDTTRNESHRAGGSVITPGAIEKFLKHILDEVFPSECVVISTFSIPTISISEILEAEIRSPDQDEVRPRILTSPVKSNRVCICF